MNRSILPLGQVSAMKQRHPLRILGTIALLLGLASLVFALVDRSRAVAAPAGGELTCRMNVREKLISGAYKVYGLKDQPISLWLAKTIFRNETNGTIKDLKVRYKLGEYADWCPWQTHAALVPTQTVVDLYRPILSSKSAGLTSRTPAELEMEYQYVDSAGNKKTVHKNQRLTMLSRREFYFTNLKTEERTASGGVGNRS